jgi:hypothetical protein
MSQRDDQKTEKNFRKPRHVKPETGFEWPLWTKAVEQDEIDPAEFFDPEEFSYRRRGNHNARP